MMVTENPDFVIEDGVLIRYRGRGGAVSVPSGVTAIGWGAFQGCGELTALRLPEGLERVGTLAFADCVNLRSLEIPKSLRSIRLNAFRGCVSLEDGSGMVVVGDVVFSYSGPGGRVVLPPEIRAVGDGAFRGCRELTEIVFPEGLAGIGAGAFFGCEGLREVLLPGSVRSLGDRAFGGCRNLERISFPEGMTLIGDWAFEGCAALREARLPETLSAVGRYAFYGCDGLRSLQLPEDLRRVGDRAFCGCAGLTEVTLPQAIVFTGLEPFSGCTLRVRARRWRPLYGRLLKGCDVVAVLTREIGSVPRNYRREAALGWVLEPDEEDPERAAATDAWLAANARSLCGFAFDHPELLDYLCARELISPKDLEEYLREAGDRGDVGARAEILSYQNRLGAREAPEALSEGEAEPAPGEGSPLSGLVFAAAGLPRGWPSLEDLRVWLARYGASLSEAVTPETDVLVANDTEALTPRHRQAETLGVPVVDAGDFSEIVGRFYPDREEVTVPGWVGEVPPEAFRCLRTLRRAELEPGIRSVSSRAFLGCPALEEVILPDTVERLGRDAFSDCPSLTLRGTPGGPAEAWAKEHGVPFLPTE